MTHETTDSALADAIWWFHGFKAAAQASDAMCDPTRDLGTKLRNARDWLSGLARGESRFLGLNEREHAIVLTEHEFEVIMDGLRGTAEEMAEAREKSMAIYRRFQAEQRERANTEVPF
ncbi:hypothetical protein [Novosphingobium sp. KN65.2]|uniref:hypothetical protein n=1 Tax=Novosphingobium sp. KN65.2 TaxID=1478134 RepID=UPI0005DEAE3F|nr:hypothetical protein [Novosphingobium sp. KN65.2]CDO37631.1 hypothetical protein SPHV1_370018 [Novosphingobium sp. KN65.2]